MRNQNIERSIGLFIIILVAIFVEYQASKAWDKDVAVIILLSFIFLCGLMLEISLKLTNIIQALGAVMDILSPKRGSYE